jgi:hypothetical protein
MPRSPTPPARPRALRRAGQFLWRTTASQIITVVITLTVGAAGAFVWGRLTAGSATPTVDAQLAELRAAGARHHEVLFVRPASLHGGLSYVVVSEEPTENSANFGRSDDLQIYDVVRGRLRKAFDFRPAPDRGERWRYRLDGVQDLENTGVQEVIGGFSLLIDSGGTRAFVPAIVSWDDVSKRYVLEPLLPQPPTLQINLRHFQRFVGVGGSAWWQVESEGVTIRDPQTAVSIHGYGGLDFIVKTVDSFRAPSGTGVIVVALIGADKADHLIEALSGWVMNPTLPKVTVGYCPAIHPVLHLVYGDLRGEIAKAYGNSGQEC